jgi:catechol 2,3-dioxygenase-like lactoylglutathione lyase family enzyme
MLGNSTVMATVAVKDLDAAKKYYQETLGLTPVHEEGEEAVLYKAGNAQLSVYRSEYAGSNKATAAMWNVDDIEGVVRALEAKGVTFEHYDFPGMTRTGAIHAAGGMKVAWFKDPDGNIHSLMNA